LAGFFAQGWRRAGPRGFYAARGTGRGALVLAAALALAARPDPAAFGHGPGPTDPADRILARIGVDEKPGAAVPAGLVFTAHDGAPVRFGDLLRGGPLILTLNYYTCPMLCPVTLRNLLAALREVPGLKLGRDYRVATVSFDPSDGVERARARAAEIHAQMRGFADPGGWSFLVGSQEGIRELTRAVGFRYAKVAEGFAHPDVSVVFTPDGRVSRYLYGVAPEPADVRLALVEAADGRIGGSYLGNRILLFCYHYDPVSRRYALYARNIMKAGGVLTLALVAGLYLSLRRGRGSGRRTRGGREAS